MLQLLGTAHYEKHYHDKIKQMMTYIQNHYKGKTAVAEIASSAYLSERECYRIFKNCLHMSPVDYLNSYRIQMACQMLRDSSESITYISHECGFLEVAVILGNYSKTPLGVRHWNIEREGFYELIGRILINSGINKIFFHFSEQYTYIINYIVAI